MRKMKIYYRNNWGENMWAEIDERMAECDDNEVIEAYAKKRVVLPVYSCDRFTSNIETSVKK